LCQTLSLNRTNNLSSFADKPFPSLSVGGICSFCVMAYKMLRTFRLDY
jgi:hypothetical protein